MCFIALFTISEVIVLALGFAGTFNVPTDPTIKDQITLKAAGQVPNSTEYDAFCDVCGYFVHMSSKHCGSCNRCVKGFDHHCKWLNNCVGLSNYRIFLALISSLTVNVVIVISFDTLVLYRYFNGDSDVKKSLEGNLGGSLDAWCGVLVVLGLLCILIFAATFNLIGLHVYLNYRGITTYELIIENRAKKIASPALESPSVSPNKELQTPEDVDQKAIPEFGQISAPPPRIISASVTRINTGGVSNIV